MVAVLTSAVLCFASGCAVTGFSSISLWPVLDLPPHGEVTEVMALWSDGVVVMPDPDPRHHGRPAPGFSGRILLYGPSHKEPLAADGTVTVYLYDITHQPDPPVPLEVWTIDPANLQRVARKDSLGWGYNLWLPWSTCSPEVRRVSLVVKYTPHEGMERFSGHTKMTVNDESGLRPPSQLEVSGTSMTPTGASVGGTSQPSVRASTIAVPRSSSLSRLVEDAGKAPPAR
jgi:hypothetical protein